MGAGHDYLVNRFRAATSKNHTLQPVLYEGGHSITYAATLLDVCYSQVCSQTLWTRTLKMWKYYWKFLNN